MTGPTQEDLLGREAELAAIREVVASAAGNGGVLILRGEAGIGKSSLLTEAANMAGTAGHRVVRASGVRTEAHLPFAGLHQLLRPLLGGLKALPSPQRAALQAAFGLADGAAQDTFLTSLGTLTLLTEAAANRPLLAIVDDAQWLDQPTYEALAFVARRLGSDPVTLIVAILQGEATSGIGSVGLPIITVQPLGDANARELLERRGANLTTAVREHILRESGGNPLALVELPAVIDARSVDGARDPLPVTARIEQAFAGKLSDIPERTAKLLLIASIDDQGSLDEIVAAAGALGIVGAGVEDFYPAIDAGLIAVDDGQLRFRHPMIRSTVAGRATDAARREAHKAIGAVVPDPDRVAWHSAAVVTAPDESIAALLEGAADRARRRGAIAVAMTLLEQAARLTPDGEARGARLLRAADHAYALGRLDVMQQLLERAGPLASAALERRRQAWLLAVRLTGPKTAREAQNVRLVVDAASQLPDEVVDLALALLSLAAARSWWMDLGPEVWAHMIEVATNVAREPDDPYLLYVKAAAAREHTTEVVAAAGRRLSNPGSIDPNHARILGTAAMWAGDLDAAYQLFSISVDACRREGRLGYAARGLVIGGWCAVQLGRLYDALPALDEGLRLAVETDQENFVATANSALAQYYALRGELEESARAIAAAERHGIHAYADGLVAHVSVARGLLALAAGHHADAFDAVQGVFVPSDEAYHTLIRTWAIPELVDAAIPVGHAADAARYIDALKRDGAVAGPWPQITMAYAQAVLAVGSGDEDAADAAFSTALGADLERWPLPKARLLLAYGIWLRRKRRVAEARHPLRRARDLFDAIGVPWMSDQARRELGATGEASSDPQPRSLDELTPQELQIAQLAANGLSNREIGERLFVSHRTVGYHLYHVYPKLGISGRAQLHAALGAA